MYLLNIFEHTCCIEMAVACGMTFYVINLHAGQRVYVLASQPQESPLLEYCSSTVRPGGTIAASN
jgi:hypothetical protein